MVAHDTAGFDVGLRDVGFGLTSLVAVALTLVAQLLWMVIFDSTGLDVFAPDLLFVHVLPALTIAFVPAMAARYLYTKRAALTAGGAVFVASALVSAYTIRFFVLCGGPGC